MRHQEEAFFSIIPHGYFICLGVISPNQEKGIRSWPTTNDNSASTSVWRAPRCARRWLPSIITTGLSSLVLSVSGRQTPVISHSFFTGKKSRMTNIQTLTSGDFDAKALRVRNLPVVGTATLLNSEVGFPLVRL